MDFDRAVKENHLGNIQEVLDRNLPQWLSDSTSTSCMHAVQYAVPSDHVLAAPLPVVRRAVLLGLHEGAELVASEVSSRGSATGLRRLLREAGRRPGLLAESGQSGRTAANL